MGWYVKHSVELFLECVRAGNIIETAECIQPKEYNGIEEEEQEKIWREKDMYGQFVRDHEDDGEKQKSWDYVTKADLKATTEAFVFAAQEQAIRTNYIKFHIDRTISSSLCRMCGQKGETVLHLVSEGSKLAQGEYKDRHDNLGRKFHWEICRKYNLEHANKSYEHQPQGVLENSHKLLWDFNIQCDHKIEHSRPDLIIVDKERNTACIIDIAVPGDNRVGTNELEKILKYQDLKMEISRMWPINQVEVIPIVVGALGTVSKRLEGLFLEKIGAVIPVEML